MQTAFFYFLAGLASLDLLFFGVRFSTLALLYVVLHLQADGAARKYLKEVLEKSLRAGPAPSVGNHSDQGPAANVIPLQPQEKNSRTTAQAAPKAPASARPSKEEEIRRPKFGGRPHEVLGIAENAATRLIVKAFRQWIRQYHPDHLPPHARENATRQARQLNEAKEHLLERRKRLRQGRVA